MNKLVALLIFTGAGFGAYFIFQDYKEKQRELRNPWPAKVANIMRMHTAKELMEGTILGNEASFFQLLYLSYQIERDGYPVLENLKAGANASGGQANEGPLMASAMLENYVRAGQLGLFADPANLARMERGEQPIATAAGWEDEPVGVGYKISPTLGAELSALLPNMVLMPVVIRNMQTDATPPNVDLLTNQWLAMRMISPECASTIREKVKTESLKGRSPGFITVCRL
jgi:hypothetical protein